MKVYKRYLVYKGVLDGILSDDDSLPSLPSITLKIREALLDENVSFEKLASMLLADPSLCALLLKFASSPIYKTKVENTSLNSVVSILGKETVKNVVMLHSVKSLFVTKSPKLNDYFNRTWRRQIFKSSIAAMIAKRTRSVSSDDAFLATLMTEIGTLAIISAFKNLDEVPEIDEYYYICRQYSKTIGVSILKKWQLPEEYVEATKQCGQWHCDSPGEFGIADIINLSLYSVLLASGKRNSLPKLASVSAYQKLKPPFNFVNKHNQLLVVENSREEICKMSQLMDS